MKTLKKIAVFAPTLSVVMVGTCIGISLIGYEAPVYKVQAFENDVIEDMAEEERDNDDKPVIEADSIEDDEMGKKTEIVNTDGKFELEDGIYEGSGTGFSGTVRVAVEIKDKKIVNIEILSNEDDAAFFNRAKEVIESIIAGQSTEVDVVSGATYSSRGIIEAVNNALKISGTANKDLSDDENSGSSYRRGLGNTSQAVEENQNNNNLQDMNENTRLKDGTYYGTGTGFAGDLTVKLVIEGGRITSASVVSTNDGAEFIEKAASVLEEIVSKQSLKVDTVSGATYSSRGMIAAAANAVSQAIVNPSAGNDIFEGYNENIAKNGTGDNNSENGPGSKENTDGRNPGNTSEIAPQISGNIPYADGIYYGSGEGFSGEVKVSVAIKRHTITEVKIISTEDDKVFFDRAVVLIGDIIEKQSTDVDTVSGATFSSEGIIEAVDAALLEAKRQTEDSNSKDNDGKESDSKNTNQENGNQNTDKRNEPRNTDKENEPRNTDEENNDENAGNDNENGKQESDTDKKNGEKDIENNTTRDNDEKDIENNNTKDNDEKDTENNNAKNNDKDIANKSIYQDGTYAVKVLCVPDDDEMFEKYRLSMKVTIQEDKIVEITDIEGDGETSNNSYIKKASKGTSKIKGMIEKITGAELTILDGGIDTVSGATCTSKSIIEGCKEALRLAKSED